MPQPRILRISEIFPSIQGEGLRQGEPTLFIRLSGCNLRCDFCDTKYAWEEGTEMTAAQVLHAIHKLRSRFPAEWVCLTGGEPLVQDITELVKGLKGQRFQIQVETNGTVYRPLQVDWYTLSPKPDSYFFQPEFKKKAREVKIIVTKTLNIETVQKLRSQFPENTPLLLQPQSNRKWSMDRGMRLLRESLKAGSRNIRLSIQLHKAVGLL
jgi:7-carboxy-7-deazaguanine synthase